MDLSTLSNHAQIQVVIDGTFQELGFLNRRARNSLTPVYDERYLKIAQDDKNVACILTTEALSPLIADSHPHAVCSKPLETFFDIHNFLLSTDFYSPGQKTTISPTAQIHPTAYIDATDVVIGERSIVGPNTVILSGSEIGDDCSIGPNSTIGYDGFEIRELAGKTCCIRHGGKVVINNNVDIQANCSIAKSVFNAPTTIGEDCKIGHMAFISHGVALDRGCKVGANAVISGSCIIGQDCWIGPNVAISNGLNIDSGCFISIGSVVINDLPIGSHVTGNFAIDHKIFLKKMAIG